MHIHTHTPTHTHARTHLHIIQVNDFEQCYHYLHFLFIDAVYLFIYTDAVSPFVIAFDEILTGPVKQFMDCSEKIGEEVKTQVGSL